MHKIGFATLTFLMLSLGIASLSHAQRLVVINGQYLNAYELADLEQRCGPIRDGIYRVQGDRWWNVMNPAHAGSVSQLCNSNRQRGDGQGGYQQGSGTGEVYGNGASAHRNGNLGQGVLIDPNAGGSWQDKVFMSR
jgi:hypothetical protein